MSVTNTVKNRIKTWVESALPNNSDVYVDWTVTVDYNKTSSTIKLGKSILEDETYNRSIPETGVFMTVPFSIRVTDKIYRDWERKHPKEYMAMDYAEDILTDIISRKKSTTEETYYIYDIMNLTLGLVRGTTLRNRRMVTYEITGELYVKFED
jgi:hypothetical protein